MTKAYKIILSNGGSLQIDEDEVEKVVAGIRTGRPVKVRQGMFNPSFWVCTVEDKDRMQYARTERIQLEQRNAILAPGEPKQEWSGLQSLQDIFKDKFKQLNKPIK